jgi:DNA-binding transcriptional ArsR family regulator
VPGAWRLAASQPLLGQGLVGFRLIPALCGAAVLLLSGRMTHRFGSGDIARRFACSWPTTSRHLRVLEQAGLVRAEKQGRERFYRLDTQQLAGVAGGWIGHFAGKPR